MQRKSVIPVNTKAEIIEAALRLFESKGYDAASVQMIIDTVGVSKGSFYYYFQSKEELLDQAVEQMTRQFLDGVQPLLDDPNLSSTSKLNRFFAEGMQWRLDHMSLIKEATSALFRDENVIIRLKVYRRTADLVGPVLAAIIAQGVRENVFDTPYPEDTALAILHIGNALGENNARDLLGLSGRPVSVDDMMRRIEYFFVATERLLGARPGIIDRSWREVAEKAIDAFSG